MNGLLHSFQIWSDWNAIIVLQFVNHLLTSLFPQVISFFSNFWALLVMSNAFCLGDSKSIICIGVLYPYITLLFPSHSCIEMLYIHAVLWSMEKTDDLHCCPAHTRSYLSYFLGSWKKNVDKIGESKIWASAASFALKAQKFG